MEQLQSHIWLTASSYMVKYLRISPYIRKPFLIYDFATAPFWIPHIRGKFNFLFYQCVGAGSLPHAALLTASVLALLSHTHGLFLVHPECIFLRISLNAICHNGHENIKPFGIFEFEPSRNHMCANTVRITRIGKTVKRHSYCMTVYDVLHVPTKH